MAHPDFMIGMFKCNVNFASIESDLNELQVNIQQDIILYPATKELIENDSMIYTWTTELGIQCCIRRVYGGCLQGPLRCSSPVRDDDDYTLNTLRVPHWCGYVRIPDGHKDLDKDRDLTDEDDDGFYYTVHGGITYARGNIIGFDCAHGWDHHSGSKHYKNYGYVRIQTENLANQVASRFV